MVHLYPADVPPSVVPPLLTVGALQLLGKSTTNEEKQLLASLGDSWNIPRYHSTPGTGYTGPERVKLDWETGAVISFCPPVRSSWPQDIPPYIPEFYDGWQPPTPAPPPYQNHSQRFLPGWREQEQVKQGHNTVG